MVSLVTISVANDACTRKLREALAMASHLRRMGYKVEVVVDGCADDEDWFAIAA